MKRIIVLVAMAITLSACLFSCSQPEAHEHEYGEWKTVKEATCTEGGLEARECECSESETRATDKVKHEYTASEKTTEPDCTNQGYIERYCTCGAKTISYTEALGHSYGAWTTYREASILVKKSEKSIDIGQWVG